MAKQVTVICKGCAAWFKLGSGDPHFYYFRRRRRATGKMPTGVCPKCQEKALIRQHEHFRAKGQIRWVVREATKLHTNFNSRCRERSWAWRELDD